LTIGLWLDDPRRGLKEGLRLAAAWHAEAVGLNAFAPELDPRTLSASGQRELARLVRNSGALPAAVRADVGGRRLADPATLDVALARVRLAFDLARELGALRVVVPFGFVPPVDDSAHERTRSALKEALNGVMSLSNSTGVRPTALAGHEPAADLKAFLDTLDSAGLVEIDLNPGALLARGEDPLKALNVLSKRVAQATSTDHFRGGSEAPFGGGDVCWPELLIALSALSHSAPVTLLAGCTRECDRTRALRVAIERLRQLRSSPFG
jgi:sugar phosphate isomerase/epimerase